MQDCVRHGRLVGDTRAAIEATKKPVIAENLTTKEILEFKSCSDAARALNIPPASVSKVVCGQMRQTHGWTFLLVSKGEYYDRNN